MSVGPGRLYVNGKMVMDLWDWTEEGEAMFDGSVDYLVEVEMVLADGRIVTVNAESDPGKSSCAHPKKHAAAADDGRAG